MPEEPEPLDGLDADAEPQAPEPDSLGLAEFLAEFKASLSDRLGQVFEEQNRAIENVKAWVQQQTDPDALARQGVTLVAPALTEKIKPLGDAVQGLHDRLTALEARPSAPAGNGQSPASAPQAPAAPAAPAEPESRAEKLAGVMAVVEAIFDKVLDKGLPAYLSMVEANQKAKRGTTYDVAWALETAKTDPVRAQVLAAQLSPGMAQVAANYQANLAQAIQQTALNVGAASFGRGLQTRAAVLGGGGGVATNGVDPWINPSLPTSPSGGLPGQSIGQPVATPPAPFNGVKMESASPRNLSSLLKKGRR